MTSRLLGALVTQGEASGFDRVTLAAIIEEASARGAHEAMAHLGLEDRAARRDMDDLRELLAAWRAAKRSALRAFVGWLVKVMLALLAATLALKLGLVALEGAS